MSVRIITGDALEQMAQLPAGSVNCIITDPPYAQTNLEWDRWPHGWLAAARRVLDPTGSLWSFGNLRLFMGRAAEFEGWTLAQDVIWEKHNGCNAFADRFRRVHEQVAHFYRSDTSWASVYKNPLFTNDATARTVRRKRRPPQWGHIEASSYKSHDGGPRLMRSVMFCRSEHGHAEHPTQKPIPTILPLIEYSCPPDGVILDPFAGSGSVGLAAQQLGRSAVLIEINPAYAAIARRRLEGDAGMFAEVAAE
ncbi:MAG: site-specific DNA-methyltransferase [Alphaproteobacteria bacterium]